MTAVLGCASSPLPGFGSQEIVKDKAQRRWNALLKNDVASAYEFISPAGRSVVTAGSYAGGIKPGFWTGARVTRVECPGPEVCEVEVVVDYTYGGRKITSPLREKWVRQDSDWWYLLER